MSAAWFAVPAGLGVLLWLATDQFIFLVVGALIGAALAFGFQAKRGGE
ncbi:MULTISPECIES: hypothetical protein [Nocardioides]|uniref:Uncharacterized protein n=1 Tax=Nocardioides vastitatis TaxID=2568655 RepID=A0ABW0ZMP9_9ACTN|nr:hypothetical protein [Nocardioides sp.]